MLIPPRCFTCGTPIGDKWSYFVDTITERKNSSKENKTSQLDIEYIDIKDDGSITRSIEGEGRDRSYIFDEYRSLQYSFFIQR